MEFIESYRLCVYVPEDALERFVAAVSPHIPAFLGSYDHVCWWSERGTEQYRKFDSTRIEHVLCQKFECSLPADDVFLEQFIGQVVCLNHPWQEPVITVTHQRILKANG